MPTAPYAIATPPVKPPWIDTRLMNKDQPLAPVFRHMASGLFPSTTETYERGKTIFFPGIQRKRSIFSSRGQ